MKKGKTKRTMKKRRDPRDPDGLGFPEEWETCVAIMEETEVEGDEPLCGEKAMQRRMMGGVMWALCDEHAAEIDEMTEEEKGNDL